jgi:hypothetical protein
LTDRPEGESDGHYVAELIASITEGRYRPLPGTAGDLLVGAHPSQDRYTAGRSLAVFARLALRSDGLWWCMALEAEAERLSDAESTYIATAWRDWIAGRNPFTGRRRVVTG